ncbi:MAG: DUF3887 domain-containing protein [Cyanobacteria bacterium REEB65]|nr:DUF3887 domain-containing protein [Cyanobacteria bacterium REEB65]
MGKLWKRRTRAARLVVAGSLLAATCTAPAMAEGSPQDQATTLVKDLEEGKFLAATDDFSQRLHARISPALLSGLWSQLTSELGPIEGTRILAVHERPNATFVYASANFAKGTVRVKAILAGDRVQGLFFDDPQLASLPSPPYASQTAFAEHHVVVGMAPWTLPGILALPKGPGPWPVALLVPRSGDSDADETTGPQRPFRDLAWGLAANGIATLRMPKRT